MTVIIRFASAVDQSQFRGLFTAMFTDEEINRICWHSRRGMLELDLILTPFVKAHFKAMDADMQQAYLRLLECEDQEMFGWFLQHKQPEDTQLQKILAFILEKHSQQGK